MGNDEEGKGNEWRVYIESVSWAGSHKIYCGFYYLHQREFVSCSQNRPHTSQVIGNAIRGRYLEVVSLHYMLLPRPDSMRM